LYYHHFYISLYTCPNVICIKLLLTYLLKIMVTFGYYFCIWCPEQFH